MNLVSILFTILTVLFGAAPGSTGSRSWESIKAEGEKLVAEHSYTRANELYAGVTPASVPEGERRWLAFRFADTLWRARAAADQPDNTEFERAQRDLEELLRGYEKEQDRDVVSAEIHESLADYFWQRRNSGNQGAAWPHYRAALDWWSRSSDVDPARKRYLAIVWKMSVAPWATPYDRSAGNSIERDILDNAVKIATTSEDRARAHFLLANHLLNRDGDPASAEQIPEELEAAMASGRSTEWYDDALFAWAQWLAGRGDIVYQEDGTWTRKPDYVRALELFRRLTTEYRRGETPFWDQANQQIEEITSPAVALSVAGVFLPRSEVEFTLNWRNAGEVQLSIYRVDLTRDVRLTTDDKSWIDSIDVSSVAKERSWSKVERDSADHFPRTEAIRIEPVLKPGAWLIEATAGKKKAREIILVSDATIVTKTSSRAAVVFVCDAEGGAPIGGARVQVWQHVYRSGSWSWISLSRTADQDGLARFDLSSENNGSAQLFVTAASGDRQAFTQANAWGQGSRGDEWKIYVTTDRPAYRPGDKVQWKATARTRTGERYVTPSGQPVEWEITDPRGTKIAEAKPKLNDFGSTWGTVEPDESMPLGEYTISFFDSGRHRQIGSATLFRLEEYKLPEFRVSVSTKGADGSRKLFRLGEKINASIEAEYYFGGPVANASVEAVIHQRPLYRGWHPPRDYPWYFEGDRIASPWYGGEPVINRQTLRTDANGRAAISFDTPSNTNQEYEYRIEARVIDASRREVTGEGSIRVTRHRYEVRAWPEHYLFRPADKVEVRFQAFDANDEPVSAEGTVTVTRERWTEVWIDLRGKRVEGKELERLREKGSFPPLEERSLWRLHSSGYEKEPVTKQTVRIGADGQGRVSFTPEREGYYRIHWRSEDLSTRGGKRKISIRDSIESETAVWVATNATARLGYRHGGLEILVDAQSFREGERAAIMIAAPASGRSVLLSEEIGNSLDVRLIRFEGDVKLIEIPLQDKHVPNFFVSAAMVMDRQLWLDTKELIVPPARQFLNVEVNADRESYQPGEEATVNLIARDVDGKPVAAEIALGVSDEAVRAIQGDYGGDPRPFFYGEKRQNMVQTSSSFQQRQYLRLVEWGEKTLIDDRISVDEKKKEDGRYRAEGNALGAAVGGGFDQAMPMSAPAPAVMESMSGMKSAKMAQSVERQAGNLGEKDRDMADAVSGEDAGGAVVVRTDFRATAFWQPDLVTKADGTATVKVKWPDSLTTWRMTASAATRKSAFGFAEGSVQTKKPLIIRLQAPRFFVVGDIVTISAIVNNNTEQPVRVAVTLDAEGLSKQTGEGAKNVDVPANGEIRIDWIVAAKTAGTAKLRVTGRAPLHNDAMEKSFPVEEHGVARLIVRSGRMTGDEAVIRLDLPSERKEGSTTMNVQVTPSLAVTMLDALPYLIDYPYGCTEQTMSRFLPAVIVSKTLRDLGLDSGMVASRVFGGIEPDFAAKTHPKGSRDIARLDDMVKKGLARLYDFQHGDGGWGWWKEGESDHFMTSYVVWGLVLARQSGLAVRNDVVDRAASWLDMELVKEEGDSDAQAWMLHALAMHRAGSGQKGPTPFQSKALERIWKNRDGLRAYSRALLALSMKAFGDDERAMVLARNLENGATIDRSPGTSVLISGGDKDAMMTAHWGRSDGYWRWADGGVESTSFVLRALMAIDPKNALVAPTVQWLVRNRRGAQWSNTRDTAIVLMSLTDYVKKSGELEGTVEFEISAAGQTIATKKLTRNEILGAPSSFNIDPKLIRSGTNEIRIRRTSGNAPLWFSVSSEFFSLEEPVKASGNEIFVRRDLHRLAPRATLLAGTVYDRIAVRDGGVVRSGERLEVVLTVEAKNDLEYIIIEDLKPAGVEAVALRSGVPVYAVELKRGAVAGAAERRPADGTGRTRWVYQELRDRKVALFIDKLPQGTWEIRYALRAEVPGKFHAMPAMAHAMYVPEVRANGEEIRIEVAE